jgi:hypothetical protein
VATGHQTYKFEAFAEACAVLTFEQQPLLRGDDFLQLSAEERCALVEAFLAGTRLGFVVVHGAQGVEAQVQAVVQRVATVGRQVALLTIMPRLPEAAHAFVVIFEPEQSRVENSLQDLGTVLWLQGDRKAEQVKDKPVENKERFIVYSIEAMTELLTSYAQARAAALGKLVHVQTQVRCAAVEPRLLQRLVELLQALVGNAVEHGIEQSADRLAKNKPEAGVITVSWGQQGEDVLVTVQDDGAGVALDVLREALVREQILTTDMAQYLGPDELCEYFFTHSFNDWHVNDAQGPISLPQVREQLKLLGGDVRMHAGAQGTMVRLHVPRTMPGDVRVVRVSDLLRSLADRFWRWFGH